MGSHVAVIVLADVNPKGFLQTVAALRGVGGSTTIQSNLTRSLKIN